MRHLLPVQHDPLLEQVLQLGNRPHQLLADLLSAQVQTVMGVGGEVLAEPEFDGPHGPFHDGLVDRGAQPGLAYLDAQRQAGPGEVLGDVGRSMVDDHGVRLDDGAAGGAGEPLVGGRSSS
ncbi:hypothetical protein [Streptomyces griseoviridis]|uniref:hypothetical protein n=1 Tax=Streptomyces griseoviridis TaxID=45398 RepID=UPI001F0CAA4D|nr:hypothetical protein [Streptomyces griseoviridis]